MSAPQSASLSAPQSASRRRLLERLLLAVPVSLLVSQRSVRAASAPQPLLDGASPQAKAVKYVEDARQASDAAQGSSCANCALYQGAEGSAQGPCQLFPGKDVRAKGWCSSWAPQM